MRLSRNRQPLVRTVNAVVGLAADIHLGVRRDQQVRARVVPAKHHFSRLVKTGASEPPQRQYSPTNLLLAAGVLQSG